MKATEWMKDEDKTDATKESHPETNDYQFIPTPRGKHLLMVNGYTYSQMKLSNNYYCSKKQSANCRARVKLDADCKIVSADYNHTHPPPKYVQSPSDAEAGDGALCYRFVQNAKGKPLLLVNGFTYCKHIRSLNYYCSKKNSGCKARIRMGENGRIKNSYLFHTHDRPKFIITNTGHYFRV